MKQLWKVLTAFVVLGGCGGNTAMIVKDPAKFEGAWMYKTLAVTFCGAPNNMVPTDKLVVMAGTTSDLTLNAPNGTAEGCNLNFDIKPDANTLTAQPSQSCSVTIDSPSGSLSGTVAFSSVTFTTTDGMNGSFSMNGTGTSSPPLTISCPYTATGTLTKN